MYVYYLFRCNISIIKLWKTEVTSDILKALEEKDDNVGDEARKLFKEVYKCKTVGYCEISCICELFQRMDNLSDILALQYATLGGRRMKVSYCSAFPPHLALLDEVFICNLCFMPFQSQRTLNNHMVGARFSSLSF